MGIQPAETFAMKSVLLNQVKHFLVRGNADRGQFGHESQNLCAVGQIATRQFTHDKGVGCHLSRGEKILKECLATTQVIDPNRSINQHRACH